MALTPTNSARGVVEAVDARIVAVTPDAEVRVVVEDSGAVLEEVAVPGAGGSPVVEMAMHSRRGKRR